MADFFAKLQEIAKGVLADKRRNISVCFVVIGLLLIKIMFSLSDPIPAAGSIRADLEKQETAKPVFHDGPIVLPPREVVRDPFAASPSLTATRQERQAPNLPPGRTIEPITAATATQGKKPANEELPVLTGIMEDSKTQVAIIRYKGVSRSYHIGQSVGQFQVIGINQKTVIILGTQGEQVLLLGR